MWHMHAPTFNKWHKKKKKEEEEEDGTPHIDT
jgi:hypothetical protein